MAKWYMTGDTGFEPPKIQPSPAELPMAGSTWPRWTLSSSTLPYWLLVTLPLAAIWGLRGSHPGAVHCDLQEALKVVLEGRQDTGWV